jgi:hypothetical protein
MFKFFKMNKDQILTICISQILVKIFVEVPILALTNETLKNIDSYRR